MMRRFWQWAADLTIQRADLGSDVQVTLRRATLPLVRNTTDPASIPAPSHYRGACSARTPMAYF
jgi:hypothetical protein